ncbi:hypothetical protein CERZMDRAFT_92713 [Cercospora zeae-maydis SCOH1-5]|uniref:SnoaL-like domain-containing protein n=1 Tax=Cercospora zeae-maydis SCOH1-5 TaxID=717836 RepID=A0A6A6FXG3_9PEZI|nr:hypothetical protein CERZMDRAFT_92713 [Cercospora zeae-maydis SCOH1-5]
MSPHATHIQESEILANIKTTMQALIDAYNDRTCKATRAAQPDELTCEPLSLSVRRDPLGGEQYKDLYVNLLAPSFKEFRIEPRSILNDPESLQSVLHGFFNMLTPADQTIRLEVMMLFEFNETGQRLVKVQEFFDSKAYLESMNGMAATVKGGK